MSKVPKFLLLAVTFLFFSFQTNAQFKLPKVLAFGNLTYANPGGDFSNAYKNGMGFEVGAGIGLGKTLLIASAGSMKYTAADNLTGVNALLGNLTVTPVKLGIRRYLLLGLFVNAEAGMAFQNYDKSSATGSSFLYEVGAGFKLLGFIELGAAYTGWQQPAGTSASANALLLKAGISIKL